MQARSLRNPLGIVKFREEASPISHFCGPSHKFAFNLPVAKFNGVNASFHSVKCLSGSSLAVEPGRLSSSDGETILQRIERIVKKFNGCADSRSRLKLLLQHGSQLDLDSFPDSDLRKENRVMGCTAQVWLTASIGNDGKVNCQGYSDSDITKGLCAVFTQIVNKSSTEEVLRLSTEDLNPLIASVGSSLQQPSRINGLYSMLQSTQKKVRQLVQPEVNTDPFPSLLIKADGGIEAQGDFAIAQALYLTPDEDKVSQLATLLQQKKMGIVAHFYMDPEVQGVLVAAKKTWPHIHISDSLVMADKAVSMVESGCESVAVLGVDFMAENVRAILGRGGFPDVPVLRMSADSIGCSLAEAADSDKYLTYLTKASESPASLHVIYINTSLETKATAHSLLPTITCTSSNVVQTVLQAFSQVPELTLWYGPDTYMGGNLVEWVTQLAELSDSEISKIHPAHNRQTVAAMLQNIKYFEDGTCVVHDLFGSEVSQRVQEAYSDAYLTAHFEVPGEMFSLAMAAKRLGKGTVGSTQNILDFISARTKEALQRGFGDRLQFVLGTESGMVTAIVQEVKGLLSAARKDGNMADVEVEIIFPVDSSAIAPTETDKPSQFPALAELAIVPGVQAGEGCSISGGCASCPYMKMNSLDALLRVCSLVGTPGEALLAGHSPRRFEQVINGRMAADVGCDPILHMRHFQKHGKLSDELVEDVLSRNR